MPIKRSVTLYQYSELSDKAKAKARDKERDVALCYDWWDSVYEDFFLICEKLGVDLKTRGPREKCVWFSGFGNQGDGASFEGCFRGRQDCVEAIKEHAPQDETLHEIAQNLYDAVRGVSGEDDFTEVSASITRSNSRYYHSNTMVLDADAAFYLDECGEHFSLPSDILDTVATEMRDLANWLYRTLKHQYTFLMSDEAIGESLSENGVLFFEDGRQAIIPFDEVAP